MPKEKIQVIFMGTDEVGVPSLQVLHQLKNYEISAVFTQPDKKIGRKQKMEFTPVKEAALALDLPCIQPVNIAKEQERIERLKPKFIITCAYGQFLPEAILKIPKYGCLNIHFSLLPNYRGASPVQSAILNGDEDSGIAFFQMVKKMDAGHVYMIKREKIKETETADQVLKRFSQIAAYFLPEILLQIQDGYLTPISQDHSRATYCKIFKREDGQIDWQNKDAKEIYNQMRAFTPWPGIFTFWNKKRLKLIEVQYDLNKKTEVPGKVSNLNGKLVIGCKRGVIIPVTVQLEGKKQMSMEEFFRGYQNFAGSILI